MPSLPLTNRLDVNLGYECNNDCLFCYFKNRKQTTVNLSTKEAKKRLTFIKKLGVDTIEFTGGEPTIRKDILELVRFAKHSLGFKKISVITNGSRFCDEGFAREAIKNGIDDVLISIHGHNEETNDLLTGKKGSFRKSIVAVKNIIGLTASCRTNTVVTKLNYQEASNIAELLYNIGIKKINFIFFSPLDDALDIEKALWPKYSEAAPFIKEMLETYKNKFETISIKVIPFCFMKGYEEYVTDFFQNIYDPYEWDYLKRVRLRRGLLISLIASLAGTFLFMDVKRILELGLNGSLHEGIMRTRAFIESKKDKTCNSCKFDLVCPGIWKPYARAYGIAELRHFSIKEAAINKITDIDWCLTKRFSNYYKKIASP